MTSPDDDRPDLFEPATAWDGVEQRRNQPRRPVTTEHCEAHERNITVIDTVNQKLNWCLGGLMALLACMGYLLLVQIDQGKIASGMASQLLQNTGDIRALQVSDAKMQEEVQGLFRWRERWEARESFSHEGKGVEKHHLEKGE